MKTQCCSLSSIHSDLCSFLAKMTKILIVGILPIALSLSAHGKEIPLEKLQEPPSDKNEVSVHAVLKGEVPEVVTDYISLVGSTTHTEFGTTDSEVIWLFIGGKGTFSVQDKHFSFADEAIAFAPVGLPTEISVAAKETLLAIRIHKRLSAEDRVELPKYSDVSRLPYFKRFTDCPAYTEAIKSPKTVSRTLLPEDIVPRMSVGTVYTTGPDEVGRHKHPMLEQLFIGLRYNNATVSADETKSSFPPLSILHIPLGSMHGTQVTQGNTLYYIL